MPARGRTVASVDPGGRLVPVPIDDHAVRDRCDEGGEAPCWAHLLDEDATLDPAAPTTETGPLEDGTQPAATS